MLPNILGPIKVIELLEAGLIVKIKIFFQYSSSSFEDQNLTKILIN